jgi:hypothetical protein
MDIGSVDINPQIKREGMQQMSTKMQQNQIIEWRYRAAKQR